MSSKRTSISFRFNRGTNDDDKIEILNAQDKEDQLQPSLVTVVDEYNLEDNSESEEEIEDTEKMEESVSLLLSPVEYLTLTIETWSWTWLNIYYTSSICCLMLAIVLSLKSPLPQFLNGVFFGVFICFLFITTSMILLVNRFLVKKPPQRKPMKKRSNRKRTERVTADVAFKGWMYELIGGEYEAKADDDVVSVTSTSSKGTKDRELAPKTQLIYVRLTKDSTLTLLTPKSSKIKKSKLIDPLFVPSFTSQRVYQLKKVKSVSVTLILPKTVRSRRKYWWSKKYPICIEMEEKKNANSASMTKIVLFVKTPRDKEEWFWRIKNATVSQEREPTVVATESGSGPTTPQDKEEEKVNGNNIPRAQSVDLGVLSGDPSVSVAAKHIDYDEFVRELVEVNTQSLSWFNALIGRVFYDFLTEPHWSRWVAAKIQRKLARIKLPYFMQNLTLSEIDVGTTLPKFLSVPASSPTVDSRGVWIDFQIDYNGGFTMTLQTKLNLMKLKDQSSREREMKPVHSSPSLSASPMTSINRPSPASSNSNLYEFSDPDDDDSIMSSSDEDPDANQPNYLESEAAKRKEKLLKFVDKIASSKYFQQATENKYIKKYMKEVSNTPIVLSVQVVTLTGVLSINIPPPPSDRLWYGFRGTPTLILAARPKLGDHEVSLTNVTEWIEKKLKAEFCKLLVYPNMDDLVVPIMMTHVDQHISLVP